ncbi:MAG: hypothetical protein WCI94_11685 [Rhodospirillales bacterium]
MNDEAAKRRKKGLFNGGLLIAFGIVSAIYGYFRDSDSLDFTAMNHALDFAILRAVLFCGAGICVILWYRREEIDFRDDGSGR